VLYRCLITNHLDESINRLRQAMTKIKWGAQPSEDLLWTKKITENIDQKWLKKIKLKMKHKIVKLIFIQIFCKKIGASPYSLEIK